MDILTVVILSIIEGITELLPISSTGHMIIVSSIIGLKQTEILKSFELFIQFGAILPLIFILKKEIFDLEILKKVVVASIPIFIIGFIFKDFFESLFDPRIVAITSIIGGILFIILKSRNKKTIKSLDYKDSIVIGLFQTLSLFPGFSRSGASMIGGILRDLKYEDLAKFSFLMGIPVLFAASAYSILKEGFTLGNNLWLFVLGFMVSFIISYIFTKWFLDYLKTKDLKIFGYYRIILGTIIIILVMLNVI